jgi:phenylalanyl-tRNA synthetase beta subunit
LQGSFIAFTILRKLWKTCKEGGFLAIHKRGKHSFVLPQLPVIHSWASVAGKKESEGPLAHTFDITSQDTYFGQSSWEQAEKRMQQLALEKLAEIFHVAFSYERAEKSYLHPGVSANVILDKTVVGAFGELDPAIALSLGLDKKVYLCELDLASLEEEFDDKIAYKNLPKFPAVKRDLALIANEELTCGEIEDVLLHSCKYVTSAKLFDVYRGGQLPEGKKSMAFTLTFTPDNNTEKAFTPETLDNFVVLLL